MTRLSLWIISLTGAFLIYNTNQENTSPARLALGWGLMAVGAIGLLIRPLLRRRGGDGPQN